MSNKILVHTCCGPCLCYPLKVLKGEGFYITAYWYNPNIHGFSEYRKRLMTVGYCLEKNEKVDIIEGNYDVRTWFSMEWNDSKSSRCRQCYKIRLEATARMAKEKSFNFFTTTLLYSRYQDHDTIKAICTAEAENYSVEFYYRDFRDGWKDGIKISKEMMLYRQQYCGCLFSEMERNNVS